MRAAIFDRIERLDFGSVATRVLCAALPVAGIDTLTSALRPPAVPRDLGVPLFFVTAWLGLALAYLPLVVGRKVLANEFDRCGPRAAAAALGAFDWLCVGYFAIVLQAPTMPDRELQLHAFYGLVPVAAAAYVAWGWFERKSRIAWHAARLVPALLALYVARSLHWDRYESVRVALIGVVIVALGAWLAEAPKLGRWFARVPVRGAVLATAAAVFALCVCQFGYPYSRTARLLLHSRSAHFRSVLVPLLRRGDRDRDGASPWFGGKDCAPTDKNVYPGARERPDDHRDSNCSGGDGVELEPAKKADITPTPGRDVLFLSFDSWRWDSVDELEAVRDAVGRRVDFTRATSPAAQTFYSLSSTIRGKPVRELVGEQGHTLWRDRDPTLADALRAAGYRPLTVVTNLRWASQYGVTGGFDVLWPTNYAARDLPHIERVNERFVDAATAFTVALTAVKETKGPVFCWLHLMEPHYPFHHGKDSGPTNRQGYQRSLRYVGALAARFVEEFRARRPDPIIALFGDHGEEFGEHGGLNHGNTVYADQVRVGFSLSLPGDLERQVDAPVSIAQLPATILEQLGLPIPASMTEPSLLAGLYGDDSAFPQVAVSEMPTPTRYMVSYTGARYRLVTDAFHDTEELFDTLHDPLESHDISAQQPRALHAMQALANAWNERH